MLGSAAPPAFVGSAMPVMGGAMIGSAAPVIGGTTMLSPAPMMRFAPAMGSAPIMGTAPVMGMVGSPLVQTRVIQQPVFSPQPVITQPVFSSVVTSPTPSPTKSPYQKGKYGAVSRQGQHLKRDRKVVVYE